MSKEEQEEQREHPENLWEELVIDIWNTLGLSCAELNLLPAKFTLDYKFELELSCFYEVNGYHLARSKFLASCKKQVASSKKQAAISN